MENYTPYEREIIVLILLRNKQRNFHWKFSWATRPTSISVDTRISRIIVSGAPIIHDTRLKLLYGGGFTLEELLVLFFWKSRWPIDYYERWALQSLARRLSPTATGRIRTRGPVVPTRWSSGAYCTTYNRNSKSCFSGRLISRFNELQFNGSSFLFMEVYFSLYVNKP